MTERNGTGDLIGDVSKSLQLDDDVVRQVVDELFLQLHRHFFEYHGGSSSNGDYIGEQLWHQIGKQAFYHLLGLFDTFAERYNWGPGSANEYLLRLGRADNWAPFRHQTEGWRRGGNNTPS